METMEERIVAAARGWLGTRFHHQGRLKRTDTHKGGVNCLGLLVGVAQELDLRASDGTPLAALDQRAYGHYPDTKALEAALARVLNAVATGALRPGDIVLLNIDGQPQHMGVIADVRSSAIQAAGLTGPSRCASGANAHLGLGLIHAYAPARKVVEHPLDNWWRGKVAAAFRVGYARQ